MMTLLVVLAVLSGLLGGLSLSEATSGVGLIAGGTLCAILARIVQSAEQHQELKKILTPQFPQEPRS